MKTIGLPRECMTGEHRVALTPHDCAVLVADDIKIIVETSAGADSGYSDQDYLDAGCDIALDAPELYRRGELIVKVKQPLAHDLEHLRAHHTVFSYLHLAADPELITRLCDIGLTAIPFESIRGEDGSLPLLAPMSAVAGRIAAIRGASLLFRNRGGSGVLLGGTRQGDNDSIEHGKVVVIGAGVAGSHAASTALALGAEVIVLDLDRDKLERLQQQHPGLDVELSSAERIDQLCCEADLVVGAVLLAGRRAPVVVRESTISRMRAGSVIIDIAIDQGGCVENIRATDSDTLFYRHLDVLHSAVPNMPAAVARTASQALSSAITPYVMALATGQDQPALAQATAIRGHSVVDPVLDEEYQRLR